MLYTRGLARPSEGRRRRCHQDPRAWIVEMGELLGLSLSTSVVGDEASREDGVKGVGSGSGVTDTDPKGKRKCRANVSVMERVGRVGLQDSESLTCEATPVGSGEGRVIQRV